MKEKRKKARAAAVKGGDNLHSDYLTIVENQRRAEVEVNFWLIRFLFQDAYQTEIMQLNGLRKERLTLIVIADFAYNPEKRGAYFPHPSMEYMANVCFNYDTTAICGINYSYSGDD